MATACVAWSPGYEPHLLGLERLHPFDLGKFGRIHRALRDEGFPAGLFVEPGEVDRADLEAVHPADFLRSLGQRRTLARALEIPIPPFVSRAFLEAHVLAPLRRMVQGTLLGARLAAEGGLGVNLGGGFHHAHPRLAHGFCLCNDLAVAVAALRREGMEEPVLVVDTDAHQGDGNHAFFREDPSVFCLSVHEEHLFPQPRVPGDRDLELPAGAGDREMLELLELELPPLLERLRPRVVFHVAGADVLARDPLTHLAMTPEGLARRDERVALLAREAGAGVVHLLAGGYGPDAWRAQARAVAGLLRAWLGPP